MSSKRKESGKPSGKPGVSRSEAARLAHLLRIERGLRAKGMLRVAGVDEAGRGPLAGPVCAGIVVFPPNARIARVNDSKKLSPDAREQLYGQIVQAADAYAVGFADPEEIDIINILNATKLAVRRALRKLPFVPDYLLLDALTIENCTIPQMGLIQGDARCFSIAAASIVAKVTRDRLLRQYAEEFPGYGFEQHKGYPTEMHMRAVVERGLCSIHRKSFFDPGFLSPGFSNTRTYAALRARLLACATPEELSSATEELRSLREYLPRCEQTELYAIVREREAVFRAAQQPE